MSARRVRVVLLCEDSQQETFVRRFLTGMNWEPRELRIEKNPRGSGEQWVRCQFPKELKAYRNRMARAATALIAVIDADAGSVQDRIDELSEACSSRQIPFRTADEAVAIAVPRRNIETWIHYLRQNSVSEEIEYPKLKNPSECRDAVDTLLEQCRGTGLKEDAPPSLAAACSEYQDRIRPLRVS
ncbi:MAG: hypothetical protein NTX53_11790 [candidate division WOR-3 bacterium]|nr:hypothetical protein [candidate division WOR-3 bacterium]